MAIGTATWLPGCRGPYNRIVASEFKKTMHGDLDRLTAALADRYAIGVERRDVGRLTTAQAAARRSVGKPTLGTLVASATVCWRAAGLPVVTTAQMGADERG